MKAFIFWYMLYYDQPIEHVAVIAKDEEQAKRFYFNYLKYTIGYAVDYDLDPSYEVEEKDFINKHAIGEILGQNVKL